MSSSLMEVKILILMVTGMVTILTVTMQTHLSPMRHSGKMLIMMDMGTIKMVEIRTYSQTIQPNMLMLMVMDWEIINPEQMPIHLCLMVIMMAILTMSTYCLT